MKPALRLLALLLACALGAVALRRCISTAPVADPIEDSYTVGSFMHLVLYPAMQRPDFARDPAAVLRTIPNVTLDGGTRIRYRTYPITIHPDRSALAAYGPFIHRSDAGAVRTLVLLLPDGQVIWQSQDAPTAK